MRGKAVAGLSRRRRPFQSRVVDNGRDADSFGFVYRIRSYIALALLALWLPATLHCEMEMAGLFADSGTCHDRNSSGGTASEDCAVDACAMLESGGFHSPTNTFLFKAPDLTACLLLLVPPLEFVSPPAIRLDRTTAPAELIQTWQFVRRAALPPRAPSFLA